MQKKYKRKIPLIIAAVLFVGSLFISSTVANAASINDLNKSSAYAREAILWMANNNIISGDSHGNFSPVKTISRAELVTLLVKALEIDVSNLPAKATFTDVPSNHWAYKYVEAGNRIGLVSGIGNGKFGVNNQSTREQITMMLMNYLSVSKEAVLANQGLSELEKYKDDSKMSDWAKASIQFAVSNKLMSGTGSDMFSPTGSATKEQIAVILYKFLNSRDTVQQNAELLKKPLVIFNGDILKLNESPEILNGDVLVPLEAIRKIGAEVTTDEQMNIITIKSSKIQGRNIYLKTGNQTAFINYTGIGDPFNDSTAQDKLTTLNNAPKKIENEVLVPIRAVIDALGMKVDWNTRTNLVAVKDSLTANNPILYNALKNTLQYKGEYSSNMSMTMKDSLSNEEFTFLISMNSAINGTNSTSKSKFTVKISGMPDEIFEYDTVNIADKIYNKDLETGEWSVLDSEDAIDQGIIYYDVVADRQETQKLLDAYGEMNIIPLGKANLNGEEVSKYQIKMAADVLDRFIPSEMLDNGLGLGDVYNKGLDYKVEIYLNSQGQLVYQFVEMIGKMDIEGYVISVNLNVDTNCYNIGKDINIVSPIQN